MIARVAAVVSVAILAAIVAFQSALILGAPWGALTQGGRGDGALDTPGRVVAAVSIAVLVLFALALLGRVGGGPLRARRRLARVGSWIAVGYGVVAVLLNAATPSARERAIWLPVSILLLTAELVTVLGSRRSPGPSADRP